MDERAGPDVPGGTVLFVCKANVCRSPLMAAGFRGGMAASGWRVESAGAATRRAAAMCPEAERVLTDAGWPAEQPPHRSRSIAHVDLGAKDLILTASREERAQVARAAPSARPRTFTLREALQLGERDATPAELHRARQTADEAGAARAYAQLLDARRGAAGPQPSPRSWLRRTETLDIRDVHQLGRRAHRAGLRHALEDATRLAAAVNAFAHQVGAARADGRSDDPPSARYP